MCFVVSTAFQTQLVPRVLCPALGGGKLGLQGLYQVGGFHPCNRNIANVCALYFLYNLVSVHNSPFLSASRALIAQGSLLS